MADDRDKKLNPDAPDSNPDLITGSPGSHPVGTGVGAASAGAAGAAIGAVAGPVGAAVGAVVGAVAGGLAGKGVAEAVNPTAEDAYWRENYRNRPYVQSGKDYDEYRPAYQHGWESRARNPGREFEEVEPELRTDWESRQQAGQGRSSSGMSWENAKGAARDAWDRAERAMPGDADRDGK